MGLTGAQGFFLNHLVQHRDEIVHPKDLEQQFDLSHATVSGILQRLETKGFIVCLSDPSDRRHKQITVTEKALACTAKTEAEIAALESRLVTGMAQEEQRQFLQLLFQAASNLADPKSRDLLLKHQSELFGTCNSQHIHFESAQQGGLSRD